MAIIPALSHVPVQVVLKGKVYTYMWATADKEQPGLKALDLVVVPFGKIQMALGRVESVNEIPLNPFAKFEYKWILCKVIDAATFEAMLLAKEEGEAQ